MPEGRLLISDAWLADATPAAAAGPARPMHVSADSLARLPVQRLARLLLEKAAEDPALLGRLHASLESDADTAAKRTPSRLIGDSVAMRRIAEVVERFGQTDDPVLITGESGT